MDKKEKLKALSMKLMFDLNDKEIIDIEKEFNNIVKSIDKVKDINISNIKQTSMIEPIRLETFLNDDQYVDYNYEEVFSNCKHFKNNMVVIKNEK